MPIVDGYSATKMIRTYEKTHAGTCLSPRASCNYRIPIFAVSASLVEKDRDKYMDIGFDGWLLKPVDFKRVNQMLKGVVDDETRDACLYQPGHWEQGGWFTKRERQPDAFAVSTAPSEKSPTSNFIGVADDEEPAVSTTGSLTPRAVPEEGQ
jgi:hypothetical protein